MSPATFSTVKEWHPPFHPQSVLPPPPDNITDPIDVTGEAVIPAIKSFPNGSAGGPCGLRPQHVKDLIGLSANIGGQLLLTTLTSFTNLVLNGHTPASIRPSIFGASLLALEKRGGGVRCIAVGSTLGCLVAKEACGMVRPDMTNLLAPCQLGFGVEGGGGD